MIEQLAWLREVTDITEATKVRRVCLDRTGVVVCAEQNRESRISQPETQTAGATEEIDGRRPASGTNPCTNLLEIRRIRCVWVARQSEVRAAVVRDRSSSSSVGCRRSHCAERAPDRPAGRRDRESTCRSG